MVKHDLDTSEDIECNMIAYASYYNPRAYKSKDETREQSVHNAQHHNYLDADNNLIALDVIGSIEFLMNGHEDLR